MSNGLEQIPGFDALPPDEQDHVRNIASISREYGLNIDEKSPDMQDLLDVGNIVIATFNALLMSGEELVEARGEDGLKEIARATVVLCYNIGKKRGERTARYQIERAVAQLDNDLSNDKYNFERMYRQAQSVKAQLEQYLDSLEE